MRNSVNAGNKPDTVITKPKKYGGIILVFFLTAVVNFAANIAVYNTLSKEDAGRYTLIWGLCLLIGPLSLLGQERQILRLLASRGVEKYSWIKDSLITVFFGVLISAITGVILKSFYHLRWYELFVVVVACLSIMVLSVFGSVLRAGGSYTLTGIAYRLLHLIFSFSVLLFFILKFITYPALISLIALASFASMFITMWLTAKRFKTGDKRISLQERVSSLIFLGFTVSNIVISYGDRMILGKLVEPAQLGVYGAVVVFMKGFELVENGIEGVLVPELCKAKNIVRIDIFLRLIILAAILAVSYNFVAPFLINLLYGSKYNSGIVLVPVSAAVGFFRIISVFPNSAFQGACDIKGTKVYVAFNYIMTFIACYGIWAGAVHGGILGAMYGLLFAYIIRCVGAYYFFLRLFKRAEFDIECYS